MVIMKLNLYIGISGIVLVTACSSPETEKTESIETESLYAADYEKGLLSDAQTFFQPLPQVATSESYPITDEKVALGKVLFLDTRLSKDGNNSCNSCHMLDKYGVDNLSVSPGDLGQNGMRNSPTVYNAAIHTSQFWDGRAKDVEEQAGMPILNPVEMNIPNEQFLIDRLSQIIEYQDLFELAFPDDEEPISYENLKMAIGAFERTLMTPSHFDDFVRGNFDALSKAEKKGLNEFIDVGCVTCHTGPALGGNLLQKFGVYGDYWELTGSDPVDLGRFDVTGNEIDKYMFKVPSLRNIEKTGPYLHDGSISDLKEVIRIMGKLQLNKDLTNEQVDNIEAFLKSLTGNLPDIS